MDANKWTARIVGALFITATAASVLSVLLINPILDDPDYLVNLAADEDRVIIGTLADLIAAVAVVGIAVMLFPVLKQHNEGIALGYVGVRTTEAAITIGGGISSLLLLKLSQEYVESGAPEASDYQPLGAVLLGARDWTDALGPMIVFCLSALILYGLLYQSELVPRFLSVWGLIGATMLLVAGLLVMYGESLTSMISVLLALPIAVNEMVLAAWLIVRGFSSSAIASESTEGTIRA